MLEHPLSLNPCPCPNKQNLVEQDTQIPTTKFFAWNSNKNTIVPFLEQLVHIMIDGPWYARQCHCAVAIISLPTCNKIIPWILSKGNSFPRQIANKQILRAPIRELFRTHELPCQNHELQPNRRQPRWTIGPLLTHLHGGGGGGNTSNGFRVAKSFLKLGTLKSR